MVALFNLLAICTCVQVLLSWDVINDSPNNIRIPSKGNLIGTMDILDEVYIEFDIIIHSWASSGWTNILHVANTADEYYPALYFDVTRMCCFYMRFSSIQDPQRAWQSPDTQIFNLNTQYNIKFTITQTSVSFLIDNVPIVSETILSHAILLNKNIYISSPLLSYDALDCTLYGLKVTTSTSAIPYNYLCDYSNRFTIQTGTWTYDSATCVLTQTDTVHEHAAVQMNTDTNSLLWTDYTLTTEFIIYNNNMSSGYPDAGPLFRAASSDNYFRIFAEVNNNVGWQTVISGSRFTGTTKYSPITFGVAHKLSIIASGCTFDIYLDNSYIFRRTDCSYTTGTVGLATYQAKVEFLSLNVIFPEKSKLYTAVPSNAPTQPPTNSPTPAPTINPSPAPTQFPSPAPTTNPSDSPTDRPSTSPTPAPTNNPIAAPSNAPSQPPTNSPSFSPTTPPTNTPSVPPSFAPSMYPSSTPTFSPTFSPSKAPITPTDAIDGVINDDVSTTQSDDGNNSNMDRSEDDFFGFDFNIILIGIGCLILICCVMFCAILFAIRVKKRKQMRKHLKSKSVSTDTTNEFAVEMQRTDFHSVAEAREVRKVTDFDIDNVTDLPEENSSDQMTDKLYGMSVTNGAIDNEFVTPIGPMGIDRVETLSGETANSSELINTTTEQENENEFDDMYEQDMMQTPMGDVKTPMGGDNNVMTPN